MEESLNYTIENLIKYIDILESFNGINKDFQFITISIETSLKTRSNSYKEEFSEIYSLVRGINNKYQKIYSEINKFPFSKKEKVNNLDTLIEDTIEVISNDPNFYKKSFKY